MPTLAERVDDIPELVRHFVRRSAGHDMPISADAIVALQETPWPGNVRELRQVVDASIAFAQRELDMRALQAALSHRSSRPGHPRATTQLAERHALVTVLERASGDTERAAELLGVHRATVYRRMKRHGIDLMSGPRRRGADTYSATSW
jgi:DNA-binding NtrC family response regulator